MAEEVTLAFLARQLERVLDRLGAIEDQITVLTGMAMRHDGSLEGLAVEVRGLVRLTDRVEHRLRKLEEETPT
jgi:hypothetical protein